MHEEVLSESQKELLPLISSFSADFGLIGGTAVALQWGHRRSIDFDLVTFSQLDSDRIRGKIRDKYQIDSVMVNETNEYTLVINGVKTTFLSYPFRFSLDVNFHEFIKMPDLIALASIKAYALGRRAKWKDYVDLYFILNKYSFDIVVKRAKTIFGNEFNERLFREELSYFDDIDYTEEIDYMRGFEVEDEAVKQMLSKTSLQRV
jgi:hypothetical protein